MSSLSSEGGYLENEMASSWTWRRRAEALEDDETVRQAVCFVEDAVQFRSIHHKIDSSPLRVYNIYHTRPVQWCLQAVVIIDMLLAFFETPTSISASSDPAMKRGYELPCGVIEGIEFFCLLCFSADIAVKFYWLGSRYFLQRKWQLVYALAVLVSMIDLIVSTSLRCSGSATHLSRWRIILRPIFWTQNSQMMKKVLHCIVKLIPEIVSVLLLLFFHIYFFTMLGMLLFPPERKYGSSGNHTGSLTPIDNVSVPISGVDEEGNVYFKSMDKAFISLLVLLTTANNPDVMIPAYTENRLYALFFIVYIGIGTFCLLNLLTAIIFKQFRGYFQTSVYASFKRRTVALRAAFEVLRKHPSSAGSDVVSTRLVREVLYKSEFGSLEILKPLMHEVLEKNSSGVVSFQDVHTMFNVLLIDKKSLKPEYVVQVHSNPIRRKVQYLVNHRFFRTFQGFIVALNALLVTLFLAIWFDSSIYFPDKNRLEIINFSFALYYTIEALLIGWGLGLRHLVSNKRALFNLFVSGVLVIVEIVHISMYGSIFRSSASSTRVIVFIRVINMLVLLKLFPILLHIKAVRRIVLSLLLLLRNIWPFAGILMSAFYIFASIGMIAFANQEAFNDRNVTMRSTVCGTYEQLKYYPNNFNDFASSLVVLWDLMVVNNWGVFLEGFTYATSTAWSQVYFVCWWLVSAVLGINLFIAMLLEAFVTRLDKISTNPASRPSRQSPQQEMDDGVSSPHSSRSEYEPLLSSLSNHSGSSFHSQGHVQHSQ
eukprot:scpid46221/ scgid28441/ Two pore calcium channel protein 2; Voltage-dependent calcium channel protein TPC2